MLERRHILGGACVTEEVWPGARVSRASYVVSMLQPKVVRDLRLHDYGYRAIPLDPAYAALTADGPIFFDETARTSESIARQSAADAAAYPEFEPCSRGPPTSCGRCSCARRRRSVQAARRHRPLLRDAARCGPRRRELHDLVRMFTMSVGDLLDDHFELDGLKGSLASTGVVGVWGSVRTPGTAYNLLHHALGELDGVSGAWGQVMGGMGAISNALARSAEAAGATIRTEAEVASIDIRDGRAVGDPDYRRIAPRPIVPPAPIRRPRS